MGQVDEEGRGVLVPSSFVLPYKADHQKLLTNLVSRKCWPDGPGDQSQGMNPVNQVIAVLQAQAIKAAITKYKMNLTLRKQTIHELQHIQGGISRPKVKTKSIL